MRKLSRYCLWSSLSWIISQKSRIYLIESSHSHNWSNNNYVFWAAFSRIRLKIFKIGTLFKKIMFVWDTREIFHKKIYIYIYILKKSWIFVTTFLRKENWEELEIFSTSCLTWQQFICSEINYCKPLVSLTQLFL